MKERTFWESIEVKGGALLDKVKELIAEGNVRRVRIRQHDRTIAEFPLTVGVVGAVLAPVLAAIGALAALITECTVDIEREARQPAPVATGGDHAPADAEC